MARKKPKKIGNIDSEFLYLTKVICKCGHRVNFISKIPYIECSHCHNLIFRNKKAEYDFRIKRRFAAQKKKEKSNEDNSEKRERAVLVKFKDDKNIQNKNNWKDSKTLLQTMWIWRRGIISFIETQK